MILNLNGDQWILKGWLKDQWKMFTQMETGVLSIPVAGPVQARVPGAVQADLLRAGIIEDWNVALKSRNAEWVEHREWSLECDFDLSGQSAEDRHTLCFGGLDHSGIVKLNEKTILEFEGMHRTWEIDITSDCLKDVKNHLRVIFFQPPEIAGQIGYTSHKMALKSRFNYTWDWCPRIVNTGIWRDVSVKSWSKARIVDFFPRAIVAGDKKTLNLQLTVEAIQSGEYTVEYALSKSSVCVAEGRFETKFGCMMNQPVEFVIEDVNADLWWPNGFGEASLYDIEVRLVHENHLCDEDKKRIGFRKCVFTSNQGAVESALPYTAVINHVPVFIRGLNWVPISPLYGTVGREDYIRYLTILKDMNINMLRVWGGAVLESVDFYDLCDEYGIMVWQEFPQSSSGIDNTPCEEQSFINDLLEVSKCHVIQRRHHACHVVWCGGNELMWHDYTPVDTRSSNINSLKKLVMQMDPGKYFLPASPSGNTFNFNEKQVGKGFNHDVHGPWDYLGEVEHYRISNIDDSLFSSEIGCTGMPRFESLVKYSDGMSLWPPDKSNPYYVHRACWWIRLEQLTAMFGPFAEDGSQLAAYVKASRYLQAESLGYSAQAARRKWPVRSGFIVWMGNEPFPNSSNTSVIEYDGTPKPAYYRLKNAFAPVSLSVEYSKVAWQTGELFESAIYAVGDNSVYELDISTTLYDSKGNVLKSIDSKTWVDGNSLQAGKISFKVKEVPDHVFLMRVKATRNGITVCSTDCIFTVDASFPFQPTLNLPKIPLNVIKDAQSYHIANNSETLALGVFCYLQTKTGTIGLNEGYFNLLPGEICVLSTRDSCNGELILDGMNLL